MLIPDGKRCSAAAFTLTEILMALAVIVILGGAIFNSTMTHWHSMSNGLTRSELWQEANEIIEYLTISGRSAKIFSVTTNDDEKKVSILGYDGSVVSYALTPNGEISKTEVTGDPVILSTHIDFEKSTFTKQGNSLLCDLVFVDYGFIKPVDVEVSTTIFGRNG